MKKSIGLLLFALFFAAAAATRAADAPLRVNMVLPDGRVLIYAGSEDGVKKGAVYEVQRDGETIAKVEITDARDFVSYGEVKEKTGDVRELDLLVPTDVKGKKEDKKKEKKKKEDKKAKDKKKKDKKKKDKKKKDKKAAAKKEKKKKEKPAEPQIRRGVEYELPSHYGTTGVMMMPTAHKLPRGRVAVALSHITLERVDVATGTNLQDSSQNSFAIAYGVDQNIEIAYYHASDQTISMSGSVPASSREMDAYMFKYYFGKRYLYKGNSVKNVHYAVEVARFVVEDDDGDDDDDGFTRITGLFSYHHPNFASHFGLYKLSGWENDDERDTGLMVGLEIPMGKEELSLIGQFDVFRKEGFYAGGARYRYEKWGTIEAGILGLSYDRAFYAGITHIF